MIRATTMAAADSDDRELTRDRLLRVIHHPEAVTAELVDVRYRIYHDPAFKASLHHLMTVVDENVADVLTPEVLAKITCEVLIVWSEYDVFSEVTGAGHFSAHLAKSKLVVVKDAGHWPPFERPEAFADVSLAFLAGGLDAITDTTV